MNLWQPLAGFVAIQHVGFWLLEAVLFTRPLGRQIFALSEEKAANWIASGPPDAVAEQISRFIEAGCNLPILRFADEDQVGQLEHCIADVLPQLLP